LAAGSQTTIESVSDLAELVDLLDADRSSGRATSQRAYRGHPRAYGRLLPSLSRLLQAHTQAGAELIEQSLMNKFRRLYSDEKHGINALPKSNQIEAPNDLQCVSVMQHYGIPTRMLDWSTNIWISSYFACCTDLESDAELWFFPIWRFDYYALEGTIWSVDHALLQSKDTERSFLRRHQGERPRQSQKVPKNVLIFSSRNTPRLKSQSGLHTFSTDILADHQFLLPEGQANQYDRSIVVDGLQKIVIAKAAKPKILQFLAREKDVHAAALFPDIVGIGLFLREEIRMLDSIMKE
jgi:hypothetical protein